MIFEVLIYSDILFDILGLMIAIVIFWMSWNFPVSYRIWNVIETHDIEIENYSK